MEECICLEIKDTYIIYKVIIGFIFLQLKWIFMGTKQASPRKWLGKVGINFSI